ncbi:MAG: 30S ribosome-binding factor RbfA [Bacteroidales bacterium]|jgi:ribosome-binding factor A|nr:30S ribosome-binding factor RbfA [Bacteroidales bacterium]
MESTRQQKVAKLIQKDIAEIIQRNGNAWFGGIMVTVSGVSVTPDLGLAKVYVSVFPVKDKDQIVKILTEKASTIRFELGKRVKNQLRIIPELKFYLDDSLDYVDNIDRILNS